MRPFPLIVAISALLVVANTGNAQFVGGFGQQQAVGLKVRTGPHSSLTYVAGAYGFGFGPIYGAIPTWYYGWPGSPYLANPIVVQPVVTPPPVIIQNIVSPNGGAPTRQGLVPPELDGAPLAKPAAAAKPGRAGAAAKPVAPDLPRVAPKTVPVLTGQAKADKIAEAGRKAFIDGQYGRALEMFRKAAEVMPNESSTQFLVSQAEFALGKYREAVAAIAAGVAIRADWPDARFNVGDLYWKSPDLYAEHLKGLRQAVATFPDDAALVFLLGHQLWFDGKRDEARVLFQKAASLGKGSTPAESFLTK
jgi:hypothetical protein